MTENTTDTVDLSEEESEQERKKQVAEFYVIVFVSFAHTVFALYQGFVHEKDIYIQLYEQKIQPLLQSLIDWYYDL